MRTFRKVRIRCVTRASSYTRETSQTKESWTTWSLNIRYSTTAGLKTSRSSETKTQTQANLSSLRVTVVGPCPVTPTALRWLCETSLIGKAWKRVHVYRHIIASRTNVLLARHAIFRIAWRRLCDKPYYNFTDFKQNNFPWTFRGMWVILSYLGSENSQICHTCIRFLALLYPDPMEC